MMHWIDYTTEHADEVLKQGVNDGFPQQTLGKSWTPELFVVKNHSFTLIDKGFVVLCGGIRPCWNGVGEAWVFASKRLNENPMKYIREFKKKKDALVEEHGYHRIQAQVRMDFPIAIRFAEFFGLKKEGLMEAYGPDATDYLMMGRKLEVE